MRSDLDRVQGAWTVTELEMDGQTMPADSLPDAKVVVEGNRFTTTGMGADYKGIIELNPSIRPHRFDLRFTTGPEKGNTNLGIYQLKGGIWKICIATRGALRPSKFVSSPGSGIAVETLARPDAAAALKAKPHKSTQPVPASNSQSAGIEGAWTMVSGVMDGKALEPSIVQWVRRLTQGNLTTVLAGPTVMLKAEFTLDPTHSPPAIDYNVVAGSHKGKTQLGIYEFEGALLKIHMARPGAQRPSAFKSVKGDGGTYTVWKRA
jgi:uncharacterized protein (TIGR03067 family)